MTSLILSVVIGASFGFVLDRVGATNPSNLMNMLSLKDFRLMKIILGAIGFASVFLFMGLSLGVIDVAHLSVKSAYVGVMVGGAILGVGFATSGYCPGTGVTALATGRKDAFFFILGGLLGAFLFMESYAYLQNTFLFEKILGGSVTLGSTGSEKFGAIFENVNGAFLGIVIGVILLIVARVLPNRCPKCVKNKK